MSFRIKSNQTKSNEMKCNETKPYHIKSHQGFETCMPNFAGPLKDKKEPAQGLKRPCEEMRAATISETPSEDLDAVHATLLEETLRLENKETATISEAPSDDLDEAYASLLEETLLENKEAQEASRQLATWRATSWTLHWMGDSDSERKKEKQNAYCMLELLTIIFVLACFF